jgi:acyl-CoA synthetase (AMP-forming)/AMP-acid ligase II
VLDPTVDLDRVGFVMDDPAGPPVERTYRQVDAEANAVARALRRDGFGPDTTIAIVAENHPAWLPAFLGIMRAGAIACPINHRLPDETLRFVLADAGATLVLTDRDRPASAPAGQMVSFEVGYEEWLDRGPFTAVEPDHERVACLMYTSGSTGRPKGVPITHLGYRAGLAGYEYDRERIRGTTALVAAPLYHLNAQSYCLGALYFGSAVVLQRRFDPARFVAAIERFRVDEVSGVPAMLALAIGRLEAGDPVDTRHVTSVSLGSAPLSARLVERIRAWFPNAAVSNSYGTTETGIATFGPHPRGLPAPPTSLGYPLPGVGARIAGAARDADQGELELRTGMMARGYHRRPEETAAKFVDGWYRTGDLVRRDENGFYFFLGRLDDMLVVGGENVYPAEVERLLESHPDVVEAAVVGVEDEIKGRVPVAFVVRRAGSRLSADGVRRYALERGPAYAHPRRVHFVAALPLAGTNKIDRRALERLAATAAPES